MRTHTNRLTAVSRLCAWMMSSDPTPMTPQLRHQLLRAVASPVTRRVAKLTALAFLVGVAVSLVGVVPFAPALLGISETTALAVTDALFVRPGLFVWAVSLPAYLVSSALWHAGFNDAGSVTVLAQQTSRDDGHV